MAERCRAFHGREVPRERGAKFREKPPFLEMESEYDYKY